MNRGLGRRGRFALASMLFVSALWASAPWIFCSETWAHEAPSQCVGTLTQTVNAGSRSPRDSAPPLAPLFL